MANEKKALEQKDFDKQTKNGFIDSSHFKHWIFKDNTVIDDMRKMKFMKSIEFELNNKNSEIKLSFLEYKSVLIHHELFIINTCRQFGFPNYVASTSVTYFKRFYLNHSLIDIDGKALACCCIFLASKTEQCLFDIKLLSKLAGIDHTRIIKSEIKLMNGIKFHLKIWNPFRSFRVN